MPLIAMRRSTLVLCCVLLIASLLSANGVVAQDGEGEAAASEQAEGSEPATPGVVEEVEEVTPTPVPPITNDASACSDGRLRIGDLANADAYLANGITSVQQRAATWQSDADLVELRLSCPMLMTGVQWEGTFFSATAQANFHTDSYEIEPSEFAPEDVPYLDVSGVSFQVVHRSLLRAGYAEDLKLAAASSVTVRRSTAQAPFGPPTAPHGRVYVHVAVEERGVLKDVWIDAQDGTIYRYDLGG